MLIVHVPHGEIDLKQGKIREYKRALRAATTYPEWREVALELDRLEGAEAWKEQDASGDYDFTRIRKHKRLIRGYRLTGDLRRLAHHLRQGIHWNLGNIGNPLLYERSRVGTKYLISDYVGEVISSLESLCDAPSRDFSREEKFRFFEDCSRAYGRSALMLSGGAVLGLFHVGVVKALWDQDLLPSVLSGSSAGSFVAAALGTSTDAEVTASLNNLEFIEHIFWRMLPPSEMLSQHALMDQQVLHRTIAQHVSNMTFEEAREHSGRALNISVSPTQSNQQARLLNHLTFPQLYLHNAVLASCAVPFLFPPVMLNTQGPDGDRVPFMPALTWMDGVLRGDLPEAKLRRLNNVNHTVVSQTNPHVVPFLRRRASGRDGLVQSSRQYLLSNLRYQSMLTLNMASQRVPVRRMRRTFRTMHSMLDQDYSGNVTMLPRHKPSEYMRMMTNPDPRWVRQLVFAGERSTWEKMDMIHNQTRVSQTLDRCLQRLRQQSRRRSRSPGRENARNA